MLGWIRRARTFSFQAADAVRSEVWADRAAREQIQNAGFDVVPSNFYSTIPSIKEIEESFEYKDGCIPYDDVFPLDPGFALREIESLLPFAEEFTATVGEGDEDEYRRFHWNNSQFSYSDAMAYYCYLRKLKPPLVLEIGSGFSTFIAKQAVEKNGTGRIVCIEPYPRPFLKNLDGVELVSEKVQSIPSRAIEAMIPEGGVLFIDSTHTVKSGSDCLHIYLRVLPALQKEVYVHVHDVFLPFGMPKAWLLERHIYWTEQYLLLAILQNNPRAQVLYGSAYNYEKNRAALERLMGGKWPPGGASLWFRLAGAA